MAAAALLQLLLWHQLSTRLSGSDSPDQSSATSRALHRPPPPLSGVNVSIDWGREIIRSHTAATVEVDVMPFLGRADFGGPVCCCVSAARCDPRHLPFLCIV